jgi:hypothetical protein
VQIFKAVFFFKSNNNNNLVIDLKFFFIWQLNICPAGSNARLCDMFFFMAILAGWELDQLPLRRQFKPVAATQCTYK